jgi:hypothetical protein
VCSHTNCTVLPSCSYVHSVLTHQTSHLTCNTYVASTTHGSTLSSLHAHYPTRKTMGHIIIYYYQCDTACGAQVCVVLQIGTSESTAKITGTFEICWWVRVEINSWTDRVGHEDALHTIREGRTILHTVLTVLVTCCLGTAFWDTLFKEWWKGREDEEKEVSSYWMPLRKRQDNAD